VHDVCMPRACTIQKLRRASIRDLRLELGGGQMRCRLRVRVPCIVVILAVCAGIHADCGAPLMHRPAFLRGVLQLRGGRASQAMAELGVRSSVPEVAREPRVIEGDALGPALQRMRRSLLQARDTSALCVVTDFDWTLTAFGGPNGERSDQCHDFILYRCSPSTAWSAEVQAFRALTREKFGAMAERPMREQIALAEWWWTSANEMMLKHNLTMDHVREAVQNANTSPVENHKKVLSIVISVNVQVTDLGEVCAAPRGHGDANRVH
jgi:hypothetical protein